MNSSLSFGQAVLTFFLPWATFCSSSWVILLEDVLPGPLRQVSFSSYTYLPSKKIFKYLALDYHIGLFSSIGLIKGTNLKLINLTKYEIVHPHFNLDYSFGSKSMFLLISFRFSNAFHARTNQGEISSRRFWQSEWRYCTAWWDLLRLKPERTFDNIEKKLISWWIIAIIIVINHQKSKCFTIAGRITRVAGSKGLNFVVVVLFCVKLAANKHSIEY